MFPYSPQIKGLKTYIKKPIEQTATSCVNCNKMSNVSYMSHCDNCGGFVCSRCRLLRSMPYTCSRCQQNMQQFKQSGKSRIWEKIAMYEETENENLLKEIESEII